MASGLDFSSFPEARTGLIYRWYHGMIHDNNQQEILPTGGTVVTDLPEKASKSFPNLHIGSTKVEFAAEYIKILGEWNVYELFTEKKIRNFVDYIAVRKGGYIGKSMDAKKQDASPAIAFQSENTTVVPWRVANHTEARNLALRYYESN